MLVLLSLNKLRVVRQFTNSHLLEFHSIMREANNKTAESCKHLTMVVSS